MYKINLQSYLLFGYHKLLPTCKCSYDHNITKRASILYLVIAYNVIKYQQFVNNRIEKIKSSTDVNCWQDNDKPSSMILYLIFIEVVLNVLR